MSIHLIMFMMMKHNRSISITTQLVYPYVQHYKVTMQQYLHMVKQVQERPIQCKDLNIIYMMNREV
jgi:hypothetical protein